jgi:hypothetical protein
MSQSYGRILFVLAGIALAVYFAWKIAQRIDTFFFPWADEKSGRPLLTGDWLGTFTPPDIDSRVMQIELHRWREDRQHPCTDCQTIEGIARTCDADGAIVTYRVSGVPLDRAAKRIRLRMLSQGYQGLIDHEITGATGQWDGANLRLSLKVKGADASTKMETVRGGEVSWKRECEVLAHG